MLGTEAGDGGLFRLSGMTGYFRSSGSFPPYSPPINHKYS